MNATKERERKRKIAALRSHLVGCTGAPDTTSLSRSYGLPEPTVAAVIREVGGF